MQDLHRTVADTTAVGGDSYKRFMRLCSCTEAILSGCGPKLGSELPGEDLSHVSHLDIWHTCHLTQHMWLSQALMELPICSQCPPRFESATLGISSLSNLQLVQVVARIAGSVTTAVKQQ